MDKLKILKELAEISEKQLKLKTNLYKIEKLEQKNKICSKYPFMIVNERVEKTPSVFEVEYPNGLPILVDSYGMGSAHWSLLEKKSDAKKRQLLDNVFWAVDRLKWAVKNSPREVNELMEVILTGGKSRLVDYWKNMPGKES